MEQVIVAGCPHDCGGSCPLYVHVEEGKIKRISPDEAPDTPEAPQLRPCARGLAQAQRLYHPDRLRGPMKRAGERGEGKFVPISWGEALDTVAREMRRIKEAYGPKAILALSGTGNTDGWLYRTANAHQRFMNLWGGSSGTMGIISFQGAIFAARRTFGLTPGHPDRREWQKSKLIIILGGNPSESIHGTNTMWHLTQAKEAGAKFVFVDPMLSESAAALADQWVPILPGTDAAMLVAMAYVLVKEGLYDKGFVERCVHGFEAYRDYLLGAEDGVAKTPEWAQAITGVPAQTIAGLAREYVALKPADLRAGWAPGRTAFGEQFHRAAIALAALSGNMGLPGGGVGVDLPEGMAGGEGIGRGALEMGANPTRSWFPNQKWSDAVLRGTAGGYPADIKMIYVSGANHLNQYADSNRAALALKSVEFVVAQEQFLTSTARYADILLAVDTHFEREDIQQPHGTGHYHIFSHQAIDRMYDCKSDLEIFSELGRRLGVQGLLEKDGEEYLREFASSCGIEDYPAFKAQGVRKYVPARRYRPLAEFVADPQKYPLPTPSGKIELYSQEIQRQEIGRRGYSPKDVPPIPKYIEHWEGPRHPLAPKYPLLLVSAHSRTRCNSTFDNVPYVRELEPHAVWISAQDARARGIKDGEQVKVFNDVGTIVLPAKVTQRIMPGAVNIYQGAWYQPDERGWDRGGCVNTVTKDTVSPGLAAATNAILVQVEKL